MTGVQTCALPIYMKNPSKKFNKPVGYVARVNLPKGYSNQYPFENGETVFVFGEIYLMPEHCVVATRDGKVLWGYHTEHFIPLTEDEI